MVVGWRCSPPCSKVTSAGTHTYPNLCYFGQKRLAPSCVSASGCDILSGRPRNWCMARRGLLHHIEPIKDSDSVRIKPLLSVAHWRGGESHAGLTLRAWQVCGVAKKESSAKQIQQCCQCRISVGEPGPAGGQMRWHAMRRDPFGDSFVIARYWRLTTLYDWGNAPRCLGSFFMMG